MSAAPARRAPALSPGAAAAHRWLRALTAGCLALLNALPARAELIPPAGVVDARLRQALYDPDQVYRLRGYVGYQIDLEFEAGEAFVGLGAGDIEGVAYFGESNHLFLKPKAPKVATNLTVLTTRRHYQLDYTAGAERPRPGDPEVIFAVRFSYPAPAGQEEEAAAGRRIEDRLGGASTRRAQNYDYWYCGGPALRPVFASDDGVHTRLRFAADADLPALFVRGDDGAESLLNYSMAGGDVIVHRVASRFILRRGRLTGCVVNKGFGGGGLRLDSGTVAPDVERRVQGENP